MRFGLALPQYDYSVPGEHPVAWRSVVEWARTAETLGFDSLWLADHLFFDRAKYGGPPDREEGVEPFTGIAALARATSRVRLGTLVICAGLRSPIVVASAAATIDRLSNGRFDLGVGAGWYAGDYLAIGRELPSGRERLLHLDEVLEVVDRALRGEVFDFAGETIELTGARSNVAPVQQPRPPILVGGKGDGLLRIVAKHADSWNTGWRWTYAEYRDRADSLSRACESIGRDPMTVSRSLGLITLVGDDESDLDRRFRSLIESSGLSVTEPFAQWRKGRLVGTPEQIVEQLDFWKAEGVDEVIVNLAAVPFAVSSMDDLHLLGDTLSALR